MTRGRRDASVLAVLVMIVVFDGPYFETFDPKVGAHLANLPGDKLYSNIFPIKR